MDSDARPRAAIPGFWGATVIRRADRSCPGESHPPPLRGRSACPALPSPTASSPWRSSRRSRRRRRPRRTVPTVSPRPLSRRPAAAPTRSSNARRRPSTATPRRTTWSRRPVAAPTRSSSARPVKAASHGHRDRGPADLRRTGRHHRVRAAGGVGAARRYARSAGVRATSVHESRAAGHWRPACTDRTVAIVPPTTATPPREGQPPQVADDETWLTQRAAEGDSAAFARLYERYERRVYNVCYRIPGSPEEAADATQEAFANVLRRLPRMTGRELSFGSYLLTAAATPATTRRAPRAALQLTAGGGHRRPGDRRRSEPTTRGARVLLAAQQESRAANARLPVRQREVLALRALGELSYDEIAEIMGMNRNSVAQLLSRARIGLRDGLRRSALGSIASASPDCERALPLLALRQDGALDHDAAWLAQHLSECSVCPARVAAMEEAGAVYRLWLPLVPAVWLRGEIASAAEHIGAAARRATPVRRARRVAAGCTAVLLVLLPAALVPADAAKRPRRHRPWRRRSADGRPRRRCPPLSPRPQPRARLPSRSPRRPRRIRARPNPRPSATSSGARRACTPGLRPPSCTPQRRSGAGRHRVRSGATRPPRPAGRRAGEPDAGRRGPARAGRRRAQRDLPVPRDPARPGRPPARTGRARPPARRRCRRSAGRADPAARRGRPAPVPHGRACPRPPLRPARRGRSDRIACVTAGKPRPARRRAAGRGPRPRSARLPRQRAAFPCCRAPRGCPWSSA